MPFEFTAPLWLYPGEGAAWYFVTLPYDVSDEIDELVPDKAGFGSVKVQVTVGSTSWQTSVFPDKQAASFVLPVKKAVRQSEGLIEGGAVSVTLRVVLA